MAKKAKKHTDPLAVHNVIIGTAGHIDHGKTALIRQLTGIDADRLPEEKERGMTIDLGFARFQLSNGQNMGVIDVPGHERFIKNMVAGASGIDLVLLVVAADDGVMPQTREHLEIMKLLGLEHGLVVVTKIDLVEDDLRELAIEDVRETVQGTFLESAPVLPVSSITGEGIEALVDSIHEQLEKIRPRSTTGVFRMPIQRVFSSKGFGTVITGVAVSGKIASGDTIEVLPLGKTGRVRGIRAYMSAAEVAQAGQSSALNVTDIDYREVHRGMVATTPGHFRHATMIEARMHYLASNSRPLRHRARIRLHCGTAEVLGHVYILDDKLLRPGSSGLVQFRLDTPVVVVPGDRFVVRLHSPMVTIGGGEILDRSRWRLKQGKSFVIDGLEKKERALGSPKELVMNAIDERGYDITPTKDAASGCGLPPAEIEVILDELLADGAIFHASRAGAVISTSLFDEARKKARRAAETFFEKNPRRLLMEKVVLRQRFAGHDVFFNDLIAALQKDDQLKVVRGEYVRWKFHTPRLSDSESAFRTTLGDAIRSSPFSPPRIEDVASEQNFPAESAAAITALLEEEGELVKIAEDIYLHRSSMDRARDILREHLEKEGAMTASQAKNWLGSSRKFVIPILELLDKQGFTVRRGDIRELKKPVE